MVARTPQSVMFRYRNIDTAVGEEMALSGREAARHCNGDVISGNVEGHKIKDKIHGFTTE